MDKESIDKIIEEYYEEIKKIVFKEYNGCLQSTEDMVQDCVLHLYKALPKFNESKAKLSTFIYKVCKNKIKDKVKTKKNTVIYSDTQNEDDNKVEDINEDFFKIVPSNTTSLEDNEYLFIGTILNEYEFKVFTDYTRNRMTYEDIAIKYRFTNHMKAKRTILKYANKVKKAWDKLNK